MNSRRFRYTDSMTNTHPHTLSFLSNLSATLAVTGISLLAGASKLLLTGDLTATGGGTFLTAPSLHGAAPLQGTVSAEPEILIGMLLILAAFFVYTIAVVNAKKPTRKQRVKRWFHHLLDVNLQDN